MEHIPFVREVDRFGGALEVSGGLPGWQRTFGEELRERESFDKIHRKEMLPLDKADFVNGDNIRMLQAGRSGRLGAKTLDEILCREPASQKHFHRDDPLQAYL